MCQDTLAELARRSGVSPSGAHKEITRLEKAGLIVTRREGRARRVSIDERSPFYSDLRGLLTKAFGPAALLAEALKTVRGVEQSFIYGSWAQAGQSPMRRPPGDVDLMVLGSPDLDQLYQAVTELEQRVGRPVNVTVRTTDEWESDNSGFAAQVRASARLELV